MNGLFVTGALATGLAAVGWIGWGYGAAHPLALATTVLIGLFHAVGAAELWRFRQATEALHRALATLGDPVAAPSGAAADTPGAREPAALTDWLARLPAALQQPVRQRIEGERAGLPGPVLTPYLVGLLVLLGMLGTFLGMVVTLNGTVGALEASADVAAMRSALAAPVKGLGLAFGTSVAGVAASAMLGLASALARRERLATGQRLDRAIAGPLRPFSLARQRHEAYLALQQQAQGLPALVAQLQGLASQLEHQGQVQHERLLAAQDGYHRSAETAFGQLAASVDRTLQHSLSESARLAGEAIQPAVQATLAGLARSAGTLQAEVNQALVDTLRQQLDGLAGQVGRSLQAQADQATHQAAAAQATLAAQDQARMAAFTQALEAMAGGLQQAWQAAGDRTLAQQQAVCSALEHTAAGIAEQAEAQARRTIAEFAQLGQAAAEAPRAAAELIGQMRGQLLEMREQFSASLARDQQLLQERTRLMTDLSSLLQALQQGAAGQHGAVQALVDAAEQTLAHAGGAFSQQLEHNATQFAGQLQALVERLESRLAASGGEFATQVQAGASQLGSVVAQASAGAAEIASLGEAFGQALLQFGDTQAQLLTQLQRVESALGQAMARSDEQLAYYVAQAREIVDLSLGAQKQIVDDLQRLAPRAGPAAPRGAPAQTGQPA